MYKLTFKNKKTNKTVRVKCDEFLEQNQSYKWEKYHYEGFDRVIDDHGSFAKAEWDLIQKG